MRAYPQRQTLFILVVCILAVGGVAFYVFQEKNARALMTSHEPIVSSVTTSVEPIIAGDWQAQFLAYSTSSIAFKPASTTPVVLSKTSNTATYKLGQSFLTQYALLRQSGLTGDEQGISNAMDKIIVQTAGTIAGPTLYSKNTIRTVPNTTQNLAAYGRVFTSVFASYSAREDEAVIAADALENSDFESLAGIDPIIRNYKAMTAQLSGAAVPSSLAQAHLDLINSLAILTFCASAFRNIDTDPYTGIAAIRAHGIATNDSDAVFSAITSYLAKQGITLRQ